MAIYIKSCLVFCTCVFSPFSIAITSLGKERADLCVFVRLYVLRVLVCVSFLLLLVSGIGRDFYLWHSPDFYFLTFHVTRLFNGFANYSGNISSILNSGCINTK